MSGKATLYELLRVQKDATSLQIKKAFHALALKLHPDKVKAESGSSGDDIAEAFRAVRKAYEILTDPQRRERYDRTGVVDDEDSQSFQDAYERFRGIKVTKEDIDRTVAEYKNSADEQNDLREFFESHAGNVRNVLAFIMGSENDDISRFVKFWNEELKKGTLSKNYMKEFNIAKEEIRSTEELDAVEEEDIGDEDEEDDDEMEQDEDEDDEEEDDDDDDDDGFIVSDEEDDEHPVDDDEEEDEDQASGPLVLTPGDAVQIRWKSGKSWYDGFIMAVNKKARTYDVQYVRGNTTERDVPASLVRVKPDEPKPKATGKGAKGSLDDIDPSLLAAFQKKAEARGNQFQGFEEKYVKRPKKN